MTENCIPGDRRVLIHHQSVTESDIVTVSDRLAIGTSGP